MPLDPSAAVVQILCSLPPNATYNHLKLAVEVVRARSNVKAAFDLAQEIGAVAIMFDTTLGDVDEITLALKLPDGTVVHENEMSEIEEDAPADFDSRLAEWRCYQDNDELRPKSLNTWWSVTDRVRLEQSACDPDIEAVFMALARQDQLSQQKPARPPSPRRHRS